MKFLVLVLSILGSVAFGRDCSLPNLNECLQQVLPACPLATIIIPPGATKFDFSPEQKAALECRSIYVAKCFRVTVIEDLNLCANDEAAKEPAPSPSPAPSPDKSSSNGMFLGTPISNDKGDCDNQDDGDDYDYASYIR